MPHHAVSYPAMPWLVYPLLGAAMGVLLFAWCVGSFDARFPSRAVVPGHSKP